MKRPSLSRTLCLISLLHVGAACSDDTSTDGQSIYAAPLTNGNSFACATCHSLSEPSDDGIVRPGHALANATRRSSYKNGQLSNLIDAVNTCVVEWMRAPAFSADDEEWKALESFLDEQTNGPTENVTSQISTPPANLDGGDFTAGQAMFNRSCVVCHGSNAVGTERGPPLFGGSVLEPEYIARRVRSSGPTSSPTYDGLTGGAMPYWAADRLSDDELRNVVAYVNMISREGQPPPTDGGVPDTGAVDSGPSGCDMTSAKIGQTATLIERFHDVGGTATIVDDCTIRIENFTFDGTGVDVRLYGGLGGDYSNGFAMGDDLRRSGGYAGETIEFRLPSDKTMADLDGVSIWCVPVGVSFGDGLFE